MATTTTWEPRQPGEVWHCDYWGEDYRVEEISRHASGHLDWIKVTWLRENRIGVHSTALDTRPLYRDRLVSCDRTAPAGRARRGASRRQARAALAEVSR